MTNWYLQAWRFAGYLMLSTGLIVGAGVSWGWATLIILGICIVVVSQD